MTSKLEQLRQADRSTSRLTDQEILFNEYEKTDKTLIKRKTRIRYFVFFLKFQKSLVRSILTVAS